MNQNEQASRGNDQASRKSVKSVNCFLWNPNSTGDMGHTGTFIALGVDCTLNKSGAVKNRSGAVTGDDSLNG